MRIVSWNMNHWVRPAHLRQRAWEYLRDGLKADVALTQESSPPSDLEQRVYRPLHDTHPRYQWGTAVVAMQPGITVQGRRRIPLAAWDFDERKNQALPESHPGASAVADIIVRTASTVSTRSASMGSGRASRTVSATTPAPKCTGSSQT